jgi:glutamate 5-kinase
MAKPAAMTDANEAAALLAAARRVTVKIGSSLLIRSDAAELREDWLASVAADLAELRRSGKQLIVASSGAVALGRARLGLSRSVRLDVKQAAAATGQPLLMQAWDRAMSAHNIATAQLLLTIGDTEARRRWLNARATLETLFARGVLPVVNENDSVAPEELRYGDNDRLSARVAQLARSDLLILLSDVDGLYTGDPARDPAARHIPRLEEIDAEAEGFAGPARGDGVGTGGMRSKLAAARIARAFGCATIIASGRDDHPLARLAGARATVIPALGSPASAYKQWIAGSLAPAGTVTIDAGAVAALRAGKSLLPAGITRLDGSFERGACLAICDAAGAEIGRGIAAYAATEAAAILGLPSARIEEKLGWRGPDELIHRDDLVLL